MTDDYRPSDRCADREQALVRNRAPIAGRTVTGVTLALAHDDRMTRSPDGLALSGRTALFHGLPTKDLS